VWITVFFFDVMVFVEQNNEDDDDKNKNNLIVVTTLIILIFIFFYISLDKSKPHISLLDECDDVRHLTSMSSETSETYKMPKTVQRQNGEGTDVLLIFKRYKSL